MDPKSAVARQQPELPAVAGVPDPHVRRCAVGVADLVTPSHWSSSTMLATSITSQRCSNFRSSIVAPIAVRTTLLAPSQPSTYVASTDSCSPVSRSVKSTRTRPWPSWATSVTSTFRAG